MDAEGAGQLQARSFQMLWCHLQFILGAGGGDDRKTER